MAEKSRSFAAPKLLMGFIFVILIFIAFGIISLFEMRTLSRVIRTIYDHPLVVSNASLHAAVSMTKMHRSMKDVVLFDSPLAINKAINEVNEQEHLVYKNLDTLKDNILGDEGRKLENETRHLFIDWKPIREEVIKLVRKGQREEAAKITSGKGADHAAKLENKMMELTSYARNKATGFMQYGEKVRLRVEKTTIILMLIGVFLSIFIAVFTIKRTQVAEEALRESEAKYRRVSDNSPAVLYQFMMAPGGEVSFPYVSDVIVATMGVTPEEVMKDPSKLLGMVHPDDQKMFQEGIMKAAESLESFPLTFRCMKDGEVIWIEARGMPTPLADGCILWDGFLLDITERKRAEEALGESEERLAESNQLLAGVLEHTHMMAVFLDPRFNFIWVNRAYADTCKHETSFFPGKNHFDLYPHEENQAIFQRVADTGEPFFVAAKAFEFPDQPERGVTYWDWSLIPIKDGTGKVTGLVFTLAEVTERIRAEEALRESEERFRTFIDFTYDWEYWLAPDGQFIYISPSCERITGYSPEEFMNAPELFEKIVHPDDHSMVVSHIRGEQNAEKLFPIDFRIITRTGEERWINHVCQAVYGIDGTYLGRRGGNRDISKHKQMEEELLKAKKLESLGVLAGGIAHDFNNLMTSVVGNISLAKMEMKPGSEAFISLVEAQKASIQTKELTARLITFSKGGGPIKETVSIGNLVKDSVNSSLKGSDIDARFSIPEDISPVEVDEEQMKQVIRNIITNAQEAMAGQGTINVTHENVNIVEKDTLTLRKGKYVKISLKDQGPGIPEEDLIKIFDPYFSTKEMGTQKGMGLGLAISDSIIKQHDGLITVESEVDSGSTFHIYLPAAKSQAPSAKPDEVQPQSTIDNYKSSIQRILVMDDEELVRDVTNGLLTHMGYKVEVAVDGVEAIEIYSKAMESEKPFDMVILDLTNKFGMGGVEAIKILLEIDPDVKAIVATGYSNDPIMSKFREHGFRGSLPKPFTLDQLRTVLSEVM